MARKRNAYWYICKRLNRQTAEDFEAVFSDFFDVLDMDLKNGDCPSYVVQEARRSLEASRKIMTSTEIFRSLLKEEVPVETTLAAKKFLVSTFISKIWICYGPMTVDASTLLERMERILQNKNCVFRNILSDALLVLIPYRENRDRETELAGRLFFDFDLPENLLRNPSSRRLRAIKRMLHGVFVKVLAEF